MSDNQTKKNYLAKIIITLIVILSILGGLIFGGVYLWGKRPWRTAVSVNGRILTVGELELRAITLLEDAKKTQNLIVPKAREGVMLEHYRIEAARKWIIKEVLLLEAVLRGYEATPEDEHRAFTRLTRKLSARKMTVDAYFKEGALPEEIKRRDFRETLLIEKFTTAEISEKISLPTKEINERVDKLKKAALIATKPGEKPKMRWDRKFAIDQLRSERYREDFIKMFRDLFPKSKVKSPLYPKLETLEYVSPSTVQKIKISNEDLKKLATKPIGIALQKKIMGATNKVEKVETGIKAPKAKDNGKTATSGK